MSIENIYIAHYPSWKGMVKVGKTTRSDPTLRINEWGRPSRTGIPEDAELYKSYPVTNCKLAEKKAHKALRQYKVDSRFGGSEWFKVEPGKAAQILSRSLVEFKPTKAKPKPKTTSPNIRYSKKTYAQNYDAIRWSNDKPKETPPKVSTDYRDNYDSIFKKKDEVQKPIEVAKPTGDLYSPGVRSQEPQPPVAYSESSNRDTGPSRLFIALLYIITSGIATGIASVINH